MDITLLLFLRKFFQIKFCITCDIELNNKLFILLYIFSLSTNQDELYFVTFSYYNTTC